MTVPCENGHIHTMYTFEYGGDELRLFIFSEFVILGEIYSEYIFYLTFLDVSVMLHSSYRYNSYSGTC